MQLTHFYALIEKWPLMHELVTSKTIEPIDLAIAAKLLEEVAQPTEELVCFFCHLSSAIRTGHLCIEVNGDSVQPTPEEVWCTQENKTQEQEEIWKKQAQQWSQAVCQGVHQLPSALFQDVADQVPISAKPLCRQNHRYYFQRFWLKETELIERFHEVIQQKAVLDLDPHFVEERLKELADRGELLKEQAQAVLSACKYPLTIICGGPGTGKTYTAGKLVKILWSCLSNDQKDKFEIALAAPTGKAAANLQQSLVKTIGDIPRLKQVKAKTLHALLGIRSSRRHFAPPILTEDLIIVDECSMIDLELMTALLKAIKPGARLILLGDPAQLPPVESGAVFKDIVQVLKGGKDPAYHPIELKQCLRAELKEIAEFASTIQRGKASEIYPFFKASISFQDIREGFTSTKEFHRALLRHAKEFMDKPFDAEAPETMFEAFYQFRILTPLRQGPFGVDFLNDLFKNYFEKKNRSGSYFAAPITIKKNDSQFELFNGETGILMTQKRDKQALSIPFQQGDYALFSDGNGGFRKIPAVLLPPFDYAYCLSVHKSQGSEFDHVLFLLPEGADYFGREVLYTAVTRAKKKLEIWSHKEILEKTLKKCSLRLSGIFQRLALVKPESDPLAES